MRTLRAGVIILASAAALVSCSGGRDEDALSSARQTWSEAGLTSYRFRLEIGDEWQGSRSYVITVKDGQVANVDPAPTSELDSPDAFFTVPALFDSIDRWWDNPTHSSVNYDDTLGYPTRIESDDPEANDDHVRLLITEFEPA